VCGSVRKVPCELTVSQINRRLQLSQSYRHVVDLSWKQVLSRTVISSPTRELYKCHYDTIPGIHSSDTVPGTSLIAPTMTFSTANDTAETTGMDSMSSGITPTTATTATTDPLQFLAFTSTVESPFWVKYCKLKLETIKLSQEPIPIMATYSVASPRLQLLESSLMESNKDDCEVLKTMTTTMVPNDRILAKGLLIGFNTLEAFSQCDKNALLSQSSISSTTDFILITFADLKQHKVLYWFGLFPVVLGPNPSYPWKLLECSPSSSMVPTTMANLPRQLHQWRILQQLQLQQQQQDGTGTSRRQGLPPYFVATKDVILPLWHDSTTGSNDHGDDEESGPTIQQLLMEMEDTNNDTNYNNVIIVVMDIVPPTSVSSSSSNNKTPVFGWPLRRLVAKLVLDYKLGGKSVTICCWRALMRRIELPEGFDMDSVHPKTMDLSDHELNDIHKQLVWIQITKLPMPDHYSTSPSTSSSTTTTTIPSSLPKVVGWEWNTTKKKPAPKWINLQPLLDPKHLAIQAADLNLKLMKWRMLPALEVAMLQQQKVLLLGAGTLGCSVARTLLGWGIRNLTLLDYGTVSYSNPVRQNLFTLDDCQGTGKPKAQAAVDALEQIAADVNAKAVRLSIPMPGHGESRESIVEAVTILDQLIQDSDVIYLLTDTRESRWLPTLMAAAHDKVMMNAALGLDSWLVMRHGGGGGGKRLGCYFCNDVVAPENSTRNRTLDQQCTVTRPGLAPIAASMAVELMVAVLHHPLKQQAPAPKVVTGNTSYNPTANTEDESSSAGALGVMPHQIRGSLVSYQMMTPTVPAFGCCTGCSPRLIEAYHENKMDLVYEVCQSTDGSYLEDLTGLTTFRAEAAEKLAAMEGDDDLWDDE
jgi:ubiquitin-like modifier-activating enzyme ATG7